MRLRMKYAFFWQLFAIFDDFSIVLRSPRAILCRSALLTWGYSFVKKGLPIEVVENRNKLPNWLQNRAQPPELDQQPSDLGQITYYETSPHILRW